MRPVNRCAITHCLPPSIPPPSLEKYSPSSHPPSLHPPLHSDAAHLPRACPFQQRSSLVTSAAVFSSLQMVCGRDTQKPRIGLSRSFSSVTCAEADKKLVVTQTLLFFFCFFFKVYLFGVAGWRKHIGASDVGCRTERRRDVGGGTRFACFINRREHLQEISLLPVASFIHLR